MKSDTLDRIPLGEPQETALLNPHKYTQTCDLIIKIVRQALSEGKRVKLCPENSDQTDSTMMFDSDTNKIGNCLQQLKSSVNILLSGNGRASIDSHGNLEVTNKQPHFLEEPDVMKHRFQALHIGSSDEVLGQIDIVTWSECVKFSLNCVITEKNLRQRRHSQFTLTDARTIIRGFAGEVLLQHMHQLMSHAEPFDPDEKGMQILDRNQPFELPTVGNSHFPYLIEFTTKYNCKLYPRDPNNGAKDDCIAEFDGVLLSGKQPGKSDYSRFYIFDATLSLDQFLKKMRYKSSKMQHFISVMDKAGIQVHIFNVLFHYKNQREKIESYGSLTTERSDGITLPLAETVDGIAAMIQSDLQQDLDDLFAPKFRVRQQHPSSPPRLPR